MISAIFHKLKSFKKLFFLDSTKVKLLLLHSWLSHVLEITENCPVSPQRVQSEGFLKVLLGLQWQQMMTHSCSPLE